MISASPAALERLAELRRDLHADFTLLESLPGGGLLVAVQPLDEGLEAFVLRIEPLLSCGVESGSAH